MALVASAVVVRIGDQVMTIDNEASIGRDPSNTFAVDHPLVSRTHAVVCRYPEGWVVEDRQSRNGIFLAGDRVDWTPVGAGVIVHLGAPDGPAVEVGPVPDWSAAPHDAPAGAGHIRIGRDADNTVVLADDLLASRHHAVVATSARGWEITDLRSHNGTFVNGQRVSKAPLVIGDLVAIGQHRFRVDGSGLREWTDPSGVQLVATDLSVRTSSGATLLADVSLSVGINQFVAIVGPSGAGKSTLLGALTGLRPATSGTVRFGGRDLYREYDDLRRRIGLVPQEDTVHPQLTVRHALSYAAKLRFGPEVSKEERTRRVNEVLAELGLTARADLRIDKLSGGQRKRVSVATELLTKPSLLFLDEPTSGLDPGYERSLMQLLRELADTGRTIVVVTHSVASLHLCDNVLVLAPGGRPAFFGRPGDAPAYFGQEDYQGIFQVLSESKDVDWPARWLAVSAAAGDGAVGASAEPAPLPKPPKGGIRQLGTLTRRYLRVMAADRVTTVLLVLQAPIVGLLQLLVLPRHELAPPGPGAIRVFSSAAALLLNPAQAATALGLNNAARELVKERALFRRERAAGLSLPAYLSSKVIVLAAVAVMQGAIMAAFTVLGENGPKSALALGQPLVELSAVIALTGIAALTLGLTISALASTENVAITMVPILIVLQNVLSLGGLSPSVLSKPVLNQAQYVSSAQWGFSAEAATADLNHLLGLSAVFKQIETVDLNNVDKLVNSAKSGAGPRRYRHLRSTWFEDMGALAALAAAGVLTAGLALGRLDPTPPPRPKT
jgi:ABC-type multidrug transport system ATPase subunit